MLQIKNTVFDQVLFVDNKSARNQQLRNLYAANREYKDLPYETQYALSLLNILDNGTLSKDRTGVGTKRIQSEKITIDLTKEFPALLGKKVAPRGALVEMLWIMLGRTDVEFLKEHGVNYWDSWVREDGSLGPIYGKQMRDFGGVDQLKDVVKQIVENPDSRRHMVSLWNPIDLKDQALECCHHDYQICSFIDHDGVRKLDLHIKQRSADCFLGVPYDFMLFAYYLHIVSLFTEIPVNKIHITMSDYHMYLNHEPAVRLYLNNYFNDPEQKFDFDINAYQNGDCVIKPQIEFSPEFLSEISDAETTYDEIDALLELIVHHNFDDVIKVTQYTPDHHYKFNGAKVAV